MTDKLNSLPFAGGAAMLASGLLCCVYSLIRDKPDDNLMEVFNAVPKDIFEDWGFRMHLSFATPLKSVMRVTDSLSGLDILVNSNGFGGNPFRFLNPQSLDDILNGAKNGFSGQDIYWNPITQSNMNANFSYEIYGATLPGGISAANGYNNAIIEDFNQHVKSYIEKLPHGKVTPEMKNFLETCDKVHNSQKIDLPQTNLRQNVLLAVGIALILLGGAIMMGFIAFKSCQPEKKLEMTSSTSTVHHNPAFDPNLSL